MVIIKHKDTKEQRISFGYKGDKRLKSRHKALRMKNFVGFVISSFAALSIFRQRERTLFLRVFVFNKRFAKNKLRIRTNSLYN